MNDRLLDKFNEIEKHHWWWEGRRELIKILLKGKKHNRILDVGCGTGETLSFLKALYPSAGVWGIDTSSKAIKYAKSRGHKNIIKTNGKNLPFKDKFFDTILFLDVLEHIKDDQAAINEASRVLRKNGEIIITSPGLSFIWSAHDTEQGHKRRYTRREIRRLAKLSGLKILFISYFNFFLSLPIIVIRLLSKINPFRTLADYDRGVNYNIANIKSANSILRAVFVSEIKALRFVRYPIGVSIAAKLIKEK